MIRTVMFMVDLSSYEEVWVHNLLIIAVRPSIHTPAATVVHQSGVQVHSLVKVQGLASI